MTPALLLLAATSAAPATAPELKLPPGFRAKLFADNLIAPDIYTMTMDAAGRVLIAGRGYVRVLVDDDHDGVADRAVDLIDGLKDGPMGLLAEGDSLFVVSDGGLQRYGGYNGTDKLKGPPERVLALKAGGEHDAHAVRRGPDGWLYLLCGNMAGVTKSTITDTRSPVKDPVAGALLRISPDLKSVEVVADGFRNPYSFDFNPDGEPFTYDSDNERCVGLPWYEGCRFYAIVPGGNYGWRSPQLSQTWRKPPYFPDVVKPICDLDRGSPTGVACYRHAQFPEKYRGGFFLADWTFGRIHFVPLRPSGSSYEGRPEVFAETVGTSGFAPTALAVHPKTGELFVSIGGRGTRGGVYRITFDKGEANPKPLPMAKRSLDYDKDRAQQWVNDCRAENASVRRRALDLIWRHRDRLDHPDAITEAVRSNLAHDDPLVRAAAGRVATAFAIALRHTDSTQARITVALASVADDPDRALAVALESLENSGTSVALKLQSVRLVQLAFGDLTAPDAVGTVWEGYTRRAPGKREPSDRLLAALRASLRLNEPVLNLEVARTFAILGTGKGVIAALAAQLTANGKSHEDIHFLAALARIEDKWSVPDVRHVAEALLGLHAKSRREGRAHDRHWPLRVDEIVEALGRAAPNLGRELLQSASFGAPEHAAFVKPLKLDAKEAAKKFLARAKNDPKYGWTPGVVALLAERPRNETNPLLEALWQRPGLDEAVLRVLARSPDDCDTPKFLSGLKSLDAELVRASADALTKLANADAEVAAVAAVRALRRFPDPKTDARTRGALFALLQKCTGEKINADEKAWATWLVKTFPDAAKALDTNDGFDSAAWAKRLAGIDWAKGDAERGRAAFTKATCAACHDGGRAVGPSLLGAAKRFGRDDLLTAILQPSKDVPPRYRPTRVTTGDDTSFTGVIVYEATDGIILQTGTDTTVRIAGADVVSKRTVEVSLMPAGLLDTLSDAEVADLLAYLGALTEPKPK